MLAESVILITRLGFGTTAPDDDEFGIEMLDRFLHTLESRSDLPAALCFYTEGVRALTEDSPVLLSLRMLQGNGVEIVACGSCLDYYGLSERVVVGEVGTMADIVERMAAASKVITV